MRLREGRVFSMQYSVGRGEGKFQIILPKASLREGYRVYFEFRIADFEFKKLHFVNSGTIDVMPKALFDHRDCV